MQESVEEVKTSVNRRVDYVLQTLKSYHIKDFTIHKSLQRVEKLYQMEVEVVVEFSDFSKCEQVCNLLVEKLDETVKVSRPFLYHTPSKLDSLRYGWFRQYLYRGQYSFFLRVASWASKPDGIPYLPGYLPWVAWTKVQNYIKEQ